MTDTRSIEDRLREEYFNLLPEIRRVGDHLEAEIRYRILPITQRLNKYERVVIASRIKECESALDALRRQQEGATFDRGRPTKYTLTDVTDLAGIRVLGFPGSLLPKIDRELQKQFESWEAKHLTENNLLLAYKYSGYCQASDKIRGELQIVPMLIGLFWEVEHSALYKPAQQLKGIDRSLAMQQRRSEVYSALHAFDQEFEDQVRTAADK